MRRSSWTILLLSLTIAGTLSAPAAAEEPLSAAPEEAFTLDSQLVIEPSTQPEALLLSPVTEEASVEESADDAAPVAAVGEQPAARASFKQSAKIGSEVPEFTPMAGKTAGTSFYIIGALFLVLTVLKKYKLTKQKGLESTALEVLARKGLGPKTALLLVSVEGRKVLLAQNGEGVELLTALDPTPNFADALSALGEPSEEPTPLPKIAAA